MEPSGTRSEQRIDELEARLAEQDHSILELSDEVYRQQRQIAKLETELQRLAERLKTQPQGAASNATEISKACAAEADEVLRCEECRRILVRTNESGL